MQTRKRDGLINPLFMAIAMFALVKPDSLYYLGLGFLDVALQAFDVLLLLVLLININVYRISKQTLLVILMYSIMTVSTLIHATNYSYLIRTIGPAVAACLYTDYCMQKASDRFVFVGMRLWQVLYTFNLISIILYPNGIYTTDRLSGGSYLLGFDNGFTLTLFPMVAFSLLYEYKTNGKIFGFNSIYSIILIVITELLVWSGSGVMMMAFFLIFIIWQNTPLVKKLIKPRLFIGAFYILTFLLVFVRELDYLAPIIIALGKDLTLTGRTYLWDYVISEVKNNWLLGVGLGGFTVVGRYNSYLHPHCLLLDLLYKGGICMFGVFTLLLHRFCKHISKCNNCIPGIIILITVTTMLMGEIINSAQYKPYFWVLIVMSSYIAKFIDGVNPIAKKELVRIRI